MHGTNIKKNTICTLSVKLLLCPTLWCTAILGMQWHNMLQPNISGTSGRAITGLSYRRLKAIHHIFRCQLPSKEPLAIGRKGWIQRSWNGKPCQWQTEGQQANTSKPSTQEQNKLQNRICYTIQLMHYSHFKTHSLQHLKPIKC